MVIAAIGSLPAASGATGPSHATSGKGLFKDALRTAVAGTAASPSSPSATQEKSRHTSRTETPWLGVGTTFADVTLPVKAAAGQAAEAADTTDPTGRTGRGTAAPAPGLSTRAVGAAGAKAPVGAAPSVQAGLAAVRDASPAAAPASMSAQAVSAELPAPRESLPATAVAAHIPAAQTASRSLSAAAPALEGAAQRLPAAPKAGAVTAVAESAAQRLPAAPKAGADTAVAESAAQRLPAVLQKGADTAVAEGAAQRPSAALQTGAVTAAAETAARVANAEGRSLATSAAPAAGLSQKGSAQETPVAAAAGAPRVHSTPSAAASAPMEGGTQSLQHRDRSSAGVMASGGETGRPVAVGQPQPSVVVETGAGEAAGATQADAAHVAAQVAAAAQRAAASMDAGTASVRLQLDPPQLGHVQITLRAAQDGIVAVLRAESPAAVAVLQGGQEDLRQRLGALGFKASAVEVAPAERPRIVVASGRSSAGRRSG